MAQYSTTNLIINYLPQEFSDEDFRALFNSIASVKRAKICRDKKTGYSYGFGFCEYYDAADATKAIQTLNGMQLQHKTLKVAYARLQSMESKNCNLHLTNLPEWVTPQDIQMVFASFGGIINCKVLHDASSMSRGIGFCLFETRSAATQALHVMGGKPWPGTIEPLIHIRFADENEKKVRPPSVCRSAATPDMRSHYSSSPAWSAVPFSPYPSTIYASPFLTPFPTHMGIPGGAMANLVPAGFPSQPMQEFAVVVNNLTSQCDDIQLYNLFYPYGGVLEASIIRYTNENPDQSQDENEQQLAFSSSMCDANATATGVVLFSNYQSAAAAVNAFNGQSINGHIVQVSLRKKWACFPPGCAGGDLGQQVS